LCDARIGLLQQTIPLAADSGEDAIGLDCDRLASFLPHLGEALLRLCEPAGRRSLRSDLERDMEQLTRKSDWRPAREPEPEPEAKPAA
jgi:hypothetical protein